MVNTQSDQSQPTSQTVVAQMPTVPTPKSPSFSLGVSIVKSLAGAAVMAIAFIAIYLIGAAYNIAISTVTADSSGYENLYRDVGAGVVLLVVTGAAMAGVAAGAIITVRNLIKLPQSTHALIVIAGVQVSGLVGLNLLFWVYQVNLETLLGLGLLGVGVSALMSALYLAAMSKLHILKQELAAWLLLAMFGLITAALLYASIQMSARAKATKDTGKLVENLKKQDLPLVTASYTLPQFKFAGILSSDQADNGVYLLSYAKERTSYLADRSNYYVRVSKPPEANGLNYYDGDIQKCISRRACELIRGATGSHSGIYAISDNREYLVIAGGAAVTVRPFELRQVAGYNIDGEDEAVKILNSVTVREP